MTYIIEVENLTKYYSKPLDTIRKKEPKRAVDTISFSVEQGQIFGFLGPNGSGKTTTIGMLLDIINRTSGLIRLFGTTDLSVARKKIGATLETPNFYPYLSGLDNLKIVAAIKHCSNQRIEETLELVKLADRKKDSFKSYSLGMKQRLALASALLSDPELVILDEPANGLDPEGIREIRGVIRDLGSMGKTVFLSSHLLDEVEQICTHVAVIKLGKLITQGSVAELTSKNPVVCIRSDNEQQTREVLAGYSPAISVQPKNGSLYISLRDNNPAALNKFLAENNIYVSHLALEKQRLEEVFLELTQSEYA